MTGPTSEQTQLSSPQASLSGLAPGVIGATGGSGTRVVARIVRHAGMFIGTDLNNYEDALPLAGFSDRWINKFVSLRGELPEETRATMADELAGLLEAHRADMPEDAQAWGWKEPRSIYLLRFLDRELPAMRFLQFVRDGRDMAFSENQNQLKKHGEAVLERDERRWKQPVQSIAVWARVNGWAAEYGEREMGDRYTAVTFEESVRAPGRDRRADLGLLRPLGRCGGSRGRRGQPAVVARALARAEAEDRRPVARGGRRHAGPLRLHLARRTARGVSRRPFRRPSRRPRDPRRPGGGPQLRLSPGMRSARIQCG